MKTALPVMAIVAGVLLAFTVFTNDDNSIIVALAGALMWSLIVVWGFRKLRQPDQHYTRFDKFIAGFVILNVISIAFFTVWTIVRSLQ